MTLRKGWRIALAGLMLGTGFAVVAAIAPPALAAGTFVDDDGNDHEANIEFIAAEGITGGCNPEGTHYCPAAPVRRDQMAAFVIRALESAGVEVPTNSPDAFTDDDDSTHEDYINTAAEMGIVEGGGDGLYHPSRSVTRGQMALFIQRAFQLPLASQDYFDDVPEVYEEAANAMAEADITRGCNEAGTLYCPSPAVRRDQMASFLARALSQGEDAGGGDTGEPEADQPPDDAGGEEPPADPMVPDPGDGPTAAAAGDFSASAHGSRGLISCAARQFWLTGPTFEASPTLYAWQAQVYWWDGAAWQLVANGPWRYKYGQWGRFSWNPETQDYEEWQPWTTNGGYFTSVDVVYSSATGGQGGDWSYEGGYLAVEDLSNNPVGRAPTYYCGT